MPILRIAAGNTLFVGTPTSSSQFRERAEAAYGEQFFNSRRVTKKQADGVRQEAWEYGRQCADPLGKHLTGQDGSGALTLADCEVWPPSGGGVRVPVVRVPLAAVDGWWPGSGEAIPTRGGGGWIGGFGVIIPLDS